MIVTTQIVGFSGTSEFREIKMFESLEWILESGLLDATNKKENFKAYMFLMTKTTSLVKEVNITRDSDSKSFSNMGELLDMEMGFMLLHEMTDAVIKIPEFKKMYASIETKRIK